MLPVRLVATATALLALVLPTAARAADPPPVTITSTAAADNGNGDIFLTPTGGTATYANGVEIVDRTGRVIWFHAIPAGQTATDFRTQTLDGKPVLTFWQGVGAGGVGNGADYIYDDHYRQIAKLTAGNGYVSDAHEFKLTPRGTALITIYANRKADLTSIGGRADQTVTDGLVQELDVHTGAVLFQWDSHGTIPFSDSHQPLPATSAQAWDWFHENAVHEDRDGNLLVDARNTWTTYKIDRTTGALIWELGGKSSTFSPVAGPGQVLDSAAALFAWQHDPNPVGENRYTLFDNESSGTPLLPYSRTVTVQLDPAARTATLVSSNQQPQGLVAASQGNAQTTANGDQFVGWGAQNHFSEFAPDGRLVLDAAFPAGVNTYRAYRLPWKAASLLAASANGGTYSATVSAPDGNLAPTGTVTFSSHGTTLCSATLIGGAASCSGPPATEVTASYSGDGDFQPSASDFTGAVVSGSVPATLALTLGPAAAFGGFTPGADNDYSATTTADVTSTAGDAALTVADPSADHPGHLVNGAFFLPAPLTVGGASLPAVARTWAAPVSHDAVTLAFGQHIGATDALRTGSYAKTLTFTLSTTNP